MGACVAQVSHRPYSRFHRYVKRLHYEPVALLVDDGFISRPHEHYADIRNRLERARRSIGPNNLLIAAHARALGLTLMPDNMREFSRVPRFAVKNWLSADTSTSKNSSSTSSLSSPRSAGR
jgi:predicted nucleic acid-binding protein